jgi:RecA-family ATPase
MRASDRIVQQAIASIGVGAPSKEEPLPTGPEDYGLPADREARVQAETERSEQPVFNPITPVAWKGTEPPQQRWLAQGRAPAADLTLYSGNGGAGKTETAVELLVSVAAGLGDWLGCVVESGPALFLSAEEPEANARDRIERICKHRNLDLNALGSLHLHFPDLEATWLATVDRTGRIQKTALFEQLESWMAANKPRLVVVDSIAAVFDGEAIARRQVRSFLAMLRKLAREHDAAAIVRLLHLQLAGVLILRARVREVQH